MTLRRARAASAVRTCDAPGCSARVARGMLMCRPHWFALPRELRTVISSTWAAHQRAAWSANVLEARRFLANHNPAAIAARVTGEHL